MDAKHFPDICGITRESVLLGNLPEEVCCAVLEQAHIRSYKRGAALFYQGEPAQTAFVILEGQVKLFRISKTSAEVVIGVYGRGQSFGEPAALNLDPYPVSAQCVTDCQLICLDSLLLRRMVLEHPEHIAPFLSSTLSHIDRLTSEIAQIKAQTATQRIASYLLGLAPADALACDVVLPVDKFLLAGMLGMGPESLSRGFARLHKYGVSIAGSIAMIEDVNLLRAHAMGLE